MIQAGKSTHWRSCKPSSCLDQKPRCPPPKSHSVLKAWGILESHGLQSMWEDQRSWVPLSRKSGSNGCRVDALGNKSQRQAGRQAALTSPQTFVSGLLLEDAAHCGSSLLEMLSQTHPEAPLVGDSRCHQVRFHPRLVIAPPQAPGKVRLMASPHLAHHLEPKSCRPAGPLGP